MNDIFNAFTDERPLAILVSVVLDDNDAMDTDSSLDELEELLETAGGRAWGRVIQSREKPDPATYLGKGKLAEMAFACENAKIELCVFDCELSPAQIANIEKALGEKVRVIDRTMLILDIFAQNARSREGMLQVEIAGLRYSLPRLTGKGAEMSRLGGGIGTRGPGETKLELERRRVKERIRILEQELDELAKTRRTQRRSRKKNGAFRVAVAGYTNAGKSTLLNALCDEHILAEDKLFATLDPTTRRWKLPRCGEVLLTDTVGFINRLPHHLVKAFHSTLEEVTDCDLILLVADASDPKFLQKMRVTQDVIASLFREDERQPAPILTVLNKADRPESLFTVREFTSDTPYAVISAKTGEGLEKLAAKTEELLLSRKADCTFLFPHEEAGKLSLLYRESHVKDVEYTENGVRVTAACDEKTKGMLARYLTDGK